MGLDFLRADVDLWTVHTSAELRDLVLGGWVSTQVGVAIASRDGDGVVVYADTYTELAEQFQLIAERLRTAATPHRAALGAADRLRHALAPAAAGGGTSTVIDGLRTALDIALTRWLELAANGSAGSAAVDQVEP